MEASVDLLYVRPHNLPIHSNILSCDIIAKAIERYPLYFFPPALIMNEPPTSATNILESLTLTIPGTPQCEQYIQLDSNETCKYCGFNQEDFKVFIDRYFNNRSKCRSRRGK